jgi:hypothetical protein
MLGAALKLPSSWGYNLAEGLVNMQTIRNNEPYSETLAGYTTCEHYGPVYLEGGFTSGNYAF